MLDKNTVLRVTNRSYGTVGYNVADLGIHREYQPGEVKEVTMEEMLKLSYSTGGRKLIEKYLVMDNADAVAQILGEVEPEYYYTADDVKKLLLEGTLAQLQDCLDFADTGVKDLVKKLAVDLEINDVAKRTTIMEKTGFDVNNAIAINHMTNEDEAEEAPTKRRSAPITIAATAATSPERRTNPPKYKVTSTSK